MPFMEYEVNMMPDFEGLDEARELLISPKKQRERAGIDVMLSTQGPTSEQRRLKNKRRLERISEQKGGVKASLEKMRQMSDQGYDTRQIGLSLIKPCMGRRMRSKKIKMSFQEKVKQVVRNKHLRKKAAEAKAKAKAKAKALAKGGAKETPEDSGELEEVGEPADQWKDA